MRASRRLAALALTIAIGACGDGGDPTGPDALVVAPGPFVAGMSYFGRTQYVEYVAGNLPIILTAPHGGTLTPAEIPDRVAAQCGGEATTVRDTNTEELVREIGAAFFRATGKYPHLVINRLHRRKLDANREITEAACGAQPAEIAFKEFQAYVDSARGRVMAEYGRGWYTDLHGHGHAVARLELGYQLTAAELRLADVELNASPAYETRSSIRTFSQQSPLPFATLVRGATSLGALFQAEGFRSVPSPGDPAPLATEEYFSGGYNVALWGCARGGTICGVQIESHFAGVRDTAASRSAVAASLVRVYGTYLRQNFGLDLGNR
jgi:hypothetical protein